MSVIELLMISPFIAEGMCCHRVTLNGLLIGITVHYSVLRESCFLFPQRYLLCVWILNIYLRTFVVILPV